MSNRHSKRWLSLCLSVSAIVAIWTLVLPWIGSRQSVRSRIDLFDDRGIDPSAIYYTDLEAMQRIESNLAAVSQAHPDAFWSASSSRKNKHSSPKGNVDAQRTFRPSGVSDTSR